MGSVQAKEVDGLSSWQKRAGVGSLSRGSSEPSALVSLYCAEEHPHPLTPARLGRDSGCGPQA